MSKIVINKPFVNYVEKYIERTIIPESNETTPTNSYVSVKSDIWGGISTDTNIVSALVCSGSFLDLVNSNNTLLKSFTSLDSTNYSESFDLLEGTYIKYLHDIFNDSSSKMTFKFDSNTNDLGGNYNCVATNITYNDGKFGKCASLNGINSKLKIPYNLGNEPMSLSLWYKSKGVGTQGTLSTLDSRAIISFQTDILDGGLFVSYIKESKIFRVQLRSRNINSTPKRYFFDTYEYELLDNEFYHIGLSYDGTTNKDSIKLYINGVYTQVTETSTDGDFYGFPADINEISLGGSYDYNNDWKNLENCDIEHFRLFNNVLSDNNFLELYDNQGIETSYFTPDSLPNENMLLGTLFGSNDESRDDLLNHLSTTQNVSFAEIDISKFNVTNDGTVVNFKYLDPIKLSRKFIKEEYEDVYLVFVTKNNARFVGDESPVYSTPTTIKYANDYEYFPLPYTIGYDYSTDRQYKQVSYVALNLDGSESMYDHTEEITYIDSIDFSIEVPKELTNV